MPPRVVVMTNANYSLSTMPHIKQTSEKKVEIPLRKPPQVSVASTD